MKIRKVICFLISAVCCVFMCGFAVGCGGETLSAPCELVSITVEGPTVTDYIKGEEPDFSDMSVKAHYDDGSEKTVMPDDYTVSGYDKNTNGLQHVLVRYTERGVTATEYITVTVGERLSVKNGDMTFENGEYTSKYGRTIALIGGSFAEGSYKAEVKLVAGGDNGIVFGASSLFEEYWEQGANYYFFFISADGSAYLGKVHDGTWSALAVKNIGNINYGICHELKCERYIYDGQYAVLRCYVDGELKLMARDHAPLSGVQYGMRAGNGGVVYKNIGIDGDTNDKELYVGDLNIKSGDFTENDGVYISAVDNSIVSFPDKRLAYGEYEVTVKKNGTADDGLIFAVTDNGAGSYWETGVSYYFFFISARGTAYLGKVNYGKWTVLGESGVITGSADSGEYMLKVVRDPVGIKCYVDGVLRVNCNDRSPLTGVGVGLRAGASGVTYGDISVTESDDFQLSEPDDFRNVSGKFVKFETLISAVNNKSLAVYDGAMIDGTVSAVMSSGSDANNGLAVRISSEKDEFYDREAGVSYYFFHISTTRTARLLRFDNGTVKKCSESVLSAGFAPGAEHMLKVTVNGGRVMCYIDGAMYADYTDPQPLEGDGVGIRASSAGTVFRDFEINDVIDPIKSDVVLFGHSHAELWSTAAADLAPLGSVANLGVGGTSTIHWLDRVKHVTSYAPKYVAMWIGSNDLAANVPVETIVDRASAILYEIKAALPEAKIVLFKEFYQPGAGRDSESYRSRVRQMNARYEEEFGNDFIICDLFDIVLKDGEFDGSMFCDDYHLNAKDYAPVTERLLRAFGI